MTTNDLTGRAAGAQVPGYILEIAPYQAGKPIEELAREFNLSETAFVLPPNSSDNTARVRIFHRTAELPFAGHPSVGTAFVLARLGHATGDLLRLEELAGVVQAQLIRDAAGEVTGAVIRSPQPLALGSPIPTAEVAACVGIDVDDEDAVACASLEKLQVHIKDVDVGEVNLLARRRPVAST